MRRTEKLERGVRRDADPRVGDGVGEAHANADVAPRVPRVEIEARNVGVKFDLRLERRLSMRKAFAKAVRSGLDDRQPFWALRDVSFTVAPGEILGVIGRNGSGKSTLLVTIAGTLPPDRGTIDTFGNRVTLLALGAGFEGDLTGRENVYLNGALLGVPRRVVDERMNEIIEFSELGAFADVPLRKYSSGMSARLGFAIASHIETDILLLDEILGVGDAAFQRRSQEKMKELMQRAKAIVIASHDVTFLRQTCTRVLWLDEGEVIAVGDPEKVVDDYVTEARRSRGPLRDPWTTPPEARREPHAASMSEATGTDGRGDAPAAREVAGDGQATAERLVLDETLYGRIVEDFRRHGQADAPAPVWEPASLFPQTPEKQHAPAFDDMIERWLGPGALEPASAEQIRQCRAFVERYAPAWSPSRDPWAKASLTVADLRTIVDVALISAHAPAEETAPLRILELGGGYGRLAAALFQLSTREIAYTLVDAVPASLCYAYAYLSQSLPSGSVGCYYLHDDPFSFACYVVPTWRVDSGKTARYDVVVNVSGFQDMTLPQVKRYTRLLDRSLADDGLVYLANSRDVGYAHEYEYPAHWQRLVETNTPVAASPYHPVEVFRKTDRDWSQENALVETAYLRDVCARYRADIRELRELAQAGTAEEIQRVREQERASAAERLEKVRAETVERIAKIRADAAERIAEARAAQAVEGREKRRGSA